MAVGGILSSSIFQALQGGQNDYQTRRNEFQQLGQDLQGGNLTAAQQDFATLTQNAAQAAQGAGNNANNIGQAFTALGQALQNGNLTQAQQDYANIQQDVQQQAQQIAGQLHRHHHHGGGGGQESNQISQAFSSLGQALQSGNLSAAQQAYATIQQDFAGSAGGQYNGVPPTTATLNVVA